MNPVDFSKFLSEMAQRTNSAIAAPALKAMQKKIEAKKAEEVEQKILGFYNQIQAHVVNLRRVRKQEHAIQTQIKKIEEAAKKFLEGQETDEDEEDLFWSSVVLVTDEGRT